MTKVRQPNSFPDGVTRVAGRIGWAAAADTGGNLLMTRTREALA